MLGPPTQQATGKIVVDIMREVEIGAMIVIPGLLESVCEDCRKQFVDYSSSLEYLFWIGGKISRFHCRLAQNVDNTLICDLF